MQFNQCKSLLAMSSQNRSPCLNRWGHPHTTSLLPSPFPKHSRLVVVACAGPSFVRIARRYTLLLPPLPLLHQIRQALHRHHTLMTDMLGLLGLVQVRHSDRPRLQRLPRRGSCGVHVRRGAQRRRLPPCGRLGGALGAPAEVLPGSRGLLNQVRLSGAHYGGSALDSAGPSIVRVTGIVQLQLAGTDRTSQDGE